MIRTVATVASFLLATTVLFASSASARDGDPDLRFSGDGQYSLGFDQSAEKTDIAKNTFVDSAGRYVMVGYVDDGKIGLARLLPNGDVDGTYAGGGTISYTAPFSEVTAATMDTIGRVVVVGYGLNPLDYDPLICRYLADGTQDTAVSATGCRFIPVDYKPNGDDRAFAVTTSYDGATVNTIFVAGSVERTATGDYDFMVIRLRPSDAAPDTAAPFGGGDGIQTVPFDLDGNHTGGDDDQARSIALVNNFLYVGGYANTSVFTGQDFAIAKIGAFDGNLVSAFCANSAACTDSLTYAGKRTFSFTQAAIKLNERIGALTGTPNGQIAVAGEAYDLNGSEVIVTKLDASTGNFSAITGNEGNRQRIALFTDTRLGGLAVRSGDSKIIVSGTSAASPGNANDPLRVMWVGQLLGSGQRDDNFASNGGVPSWVTSYTFPKLSPATPIDHAGGALTLDRGRILLTGARLWQRDTTNGVNDFDYAIVRMQGDTIFTDGFNF